MKDKELHFHEMMRMLVPAPRSSDAYDIKRDRDARASSFASALKQIARACWMHAKGRVV